jgi:Ala-tRNA(Pro) deacylase
MVPTKLRQYLDSNNIRYVIMSHSRAYTATETAEAAHVHGEAFAKVTMVKVDGRLVMAVLAAADMVDLDLFRGVCKAEHAELAQEYEFKDIFPDCEPGAMPPFGNLYDVDVYVEEALTLNRRIAFNAGSHTELVQMGYDDFERLVNPIVARFSTDYAT